MQTKTWQRKVVESAKQKGELCRLYWFVNVAVPGRHYDDRKSREQPGMFPKSTVPVIRIGADEIESRHHAETLAEIFAFVNRGRGFKVAVEITDADMLANGWHWYEWGERWDCVCAVCGAVFSDTVPTLDCCEECRTH